ncbi:MAG: hypothetical protein ABI425_03085 [Patescibacteria group bacterium]
MFLLSTLIADSLWGTIQAPPGVASYQTGLAAGQIGIVVFASNIIKLITVIAGIWSLFNLIMAGFKYITASNDVKAVETAWQSIYMSLIGLVIIVSSFTITAVASFVIFGDPTFILNPKITGIAP